MSFFQAVDSAPPWSWGLWRVGTWSFSTAVPTLCSSTTSMTGWTWLEKKRSSSAQVGPPPSGPFQVLPQPSACHGALLSTTDSSRARPPGAGSSWGHLPACPATPSFPTSPLSWLFPASSKWLFLPEPDTDTINCEQFSRLLCDMEADEETRETYASIGEEAF